jgi:hypothetical protein
MMIFDPEIKNDIMKSNLVILSMIVLLASPGVNAQKWRLNVSAGVDNAAGAIAGTTGGIISSRVGVGGGLDLEMNCSETVSLQLGAHYTQQGFGVSNDDGDAASMRIDVITVPLLLRLKASKSLYFLAGPQFGFVIDGKVKSNGSPEQDVKDMLASTDYYAVFGAGYRFTNNIFIDARYHYGFNNMADELGPDQELKNRYLSFRLGYSFPLGGGMKKK